MGRGFGFDTRLDRPDSLRESLRPLAIWLGLGTFFVGALALGAALADQSGATEAFAGPMFLLLGVALVGGGFLMDTTDFFLDPEVEFDGREWYVVAGASLFLLVLAVGAGVLVVL
jgi:hypothetical protein